jgi:hypothetical protein
MKSELGSPFLPQPTTAAFTAELAEGTPRIAGSFMVYTFDSLEECWKRIKSDIYYTSGVWDKENLRVEQLLN